MFDMRAAVFACAASILCAGCGSSSQATSTTPVAATQVVPTAQVLPTAPPPAQSLATTVPTAKPAGNGSYADSQTGMVASIKAVVADTQGGQYIKPKAGMFWEELNIVIKNTGTSPQDYNPYDFKALDKQGQEYSVAYTGSDKPTLNSGKIPPGEQRAGWLAFEVPRTAGTLTITWGDSYKLDPPAELIKYTIKA